MATHMQRTLREPFTYRIKKPTKHRIDGMPTSVSGLTSLPPASGVGIKAMEVSKYPLREDSMKLLLAVPKRTAEHSKRAEDNVRPAGIKSNLTPRDRQRPKRNYSLGIELVS